MRNSHLNLQNVEVCIIPVHGRLRGPMDEFVSDFGPFLKCSFHWRFFAGKGLQHGPIHLMDWRRRNLEQQRFNFRADENQKLLDCEFSGYRGVDPP